MKIIRTIIITALAIPTVLIACLLIAFFAPMLAGYRVNASSSDVAKIAAERNDVSVCRSILNMGFLVPTSWESRVHCVHEYASITKDPWACVGLRLDATLACVGAATENQPCLFTDKNTVVWNDGKYNEIPYDQCSIKVTSEMGMKCCAIAKAAFGTNFLDCGALGISDSRYVNQCLNELAKKTLDISLCSKISSENLSSACTVRIRALTQIAS